MKPRRSSPRRRLAPRWISGEWEQATERMLSRCHGRCELCGAMLNGDLERHHRARRRDGGDRLSNLLALHSGCHRFVTEHPEWSRVHGYILWSQDDPTLYPVWQWGSRWVLLDDVGVADRMSPQPRSPGGLGVLNSRPPMAPPTPT